VWANEVARLVGSVPLSPPPVYGLMMDSSARCGLQRERLECCASIWLALVLLTVLT